MDSEKSNGDPYKALQDAFNITLPAKSAPSKNFSLFRTHFREAAYGHGTEINEITQINSSALVALMCFYPINDKNPIEITVSSGNEHHRLHFSSLVLEKENPVYAANHPSSIDIALYGFDVNTGESVVLFLESKFGEYLTPGDFDSHYGKSYRTDYEDINKKKEELHLLEDVSFHAGDHGASIKGGHHYNDGIKQIVSHFIGAKKSYELISEGRKVYLGTILFDFSGLVDEGKTLLDDYCNCYKDLAKILNSIAADQKVNVSVIDNACTYQDFFRQAEFFKMDEDVKEFYKL
ncbi:MAG: hypothetical protein MJY70_03465 [Bacteroidales bacterium]|nr:hypothetical protein [Bacteroidales bacterium]